MIWSYNITFLLCCNSPHSCQNNGDNILEQQFCWKLLLPSCFRILYSICIYIWLNFFFYRNYVEDKNIVNCWSSPGICWHILRHLISRIAGFFWKYTTTFFPIFNYCVRYLIFFLFFWNYIHESHKHWFNQSVKKHIIMNYCFSVEEPHILNIWVRGSIQKVMIGTVNRKG